MPNRITVAGPADTSLHVLWYADFARGSQGTHVVWTWCAGYATFTVHRTPEPFQSRTFKLHEFTASNGVRIGSKNSPLFIDQDHIFLQGAYREFDRKPSVHYIETLAEFEAVVKRQGEALVELDRAVWAEGYRPRVIAAKDGGDYGG